MGGRLTSGMVIFVPDSLPINADTVNLAQRLEELNKELDTECLISGATFDAAGPDCGDATAIGAVHVRGREGAVEVFALQRPPLAVNTASRLSSSRRSFMTQDDKSYRGITRNQES